MRANYTIINRSNSNNQNNACLLLSSLNIHLLIVIQNISHLCIDTFWRQEKIIFLETLSTDPDMFRQSGYMSAIGRPSVVMKLRSTSKSDRVIWKLYYSSFKWIYNANSLCNQIVLMDEP